MNFLNGKSDSLATGSQIKTSSHTSTCDYDVGYNQCISDFVQHLSNIEGSIKLTKNVLQLMPFDTRKPAECGRCSKSTSSKSNSSKTNSSRSSEDKNSTSSDSDELMRSSPEETRKTTNIQNTGNVSHVSDADQETKLFHDPNESKIKRANIENYRKNINKTKTANILTSSKKDLQNSPSQNSTNPFCSSEANLSKISFINPRDLFGPQNRKTHLGNIARVPFFKDTDSLPFRPENIFGFGSQSKDAPTGSNELRKPAENAYGAELNLSNYKEYYKYQNRNKSKGRIESTLLLEDTESTVKNNGNVVMGSSTIDIESDEERENTHNGTEEVEAAAVDEGVDVSADDVDMENKSPDSVQRESNVANAEFNFCIKNTKPSDSHSSDKILNKSIQEKGEVMKVADHINASDNSNASKKSESAKHSKLSKTSIDLSESTITTKPNSTLSSTPRNSFNNPLCPSLTIKISNINTSENENGRNVHVATPYPSINEENMFDNRKNKSNVNTSKRKRCHKYSPY